jgi:hypothetical protein
VESPHLVLVVARVLVVIKVVHLLILLLVLGLEWGSGGPGEVGGVW